MQHKLVLDDTVQIVDKQQAVRADKMMFKHTVLAAETCDAIAALTNTTDSERFTVQYRGAAVLSIILRSSCT